jgi:putative methyltransferase (TIGR04325 family)
MTFFQNTKKIARLFIPPLLYTGAHKVLKFIRPDPYGFFGTYKDYEEAKRHCGGYEDPHLIEKISQKSKEQMTRSSFLNDRDQQLLSAFFMTAASYDKPIHVVDFGGSLGGHFFCIRKFAPPSLSFQWTVWETKAMGEEGTKNFSTPSLKFISSPEELEKSNPIHIVLASGALQYTPKPLDYFNQLAGLNPDYIILNRIPFIQEAEDRLTLQVVSPHIQYGSYPAWFFSEKKWLDHFNPQFDLHAQWDVPQDCPTLDGVSVPYKGLILKKKLKKPL